MQITVLYFASARTAVDKHEERLELDAQQCTVADLNQVLLDRYSGTSNGLAGVLKKSAWSLNEELVYDTRATALSDGDVVAVLPPVSGG